MDQHDGSEAEQHRGIVHSATDLFLSNTRTLIEQLTQVGVAGAQAVTPEPVRASASHVLDSMRKVTELAPQVTAELDIVMKEIHAKRLTIQALTAELSVLDDQLAVLEQSLAPLQALSRQWTTVQDTLPHWLDRPLGEKD
ncbi:hypothetical protein [Kribbia dieselivorans]|uniref:hypothetical protein n=1 Tax=Kribbia dieselivorans TaxID=331526 RepID=UPI000838721A|nr:hypothetical protein [Kribbia dieselivorans]